MIIVYNYAWSMKKMTDGVFQFGQAIVSYAYEWPPPVGEPLSSVGFLSSVTTTLMLTVGRSGAEIALGVNSTLPLLKCE